MKTMLSKKLLAAVTAASLVMSFAIAQEKTDHSATGHDMNAMSAPKGDQGLSSMAFAKANAAMHTGMDIEYSGNADVDFARGMIPHHQGAVEMAKIELEFGKDPELRKLAEEIIKAQETEIAFMKGWLEKNAE
jgi:uncharacterized protein (DUF305 family)